jgi:hypothetical protein
MKKILMMQSTRCWWKKKRILRVLNGRFLKALKVLTDDIKKNQSPNSQLQLTVKNLLEQMDVMNCNEECVECRSVWNEPIRHGQYQVWSELEFSDD